MVPHTLLRVFVVFNKRTKLINSYLTVLYNNQHGFKDLEKGEKSHCQESLLTMRLIHNHQSRFNKLLILLVLSKVSCANYNHQSRFNKLLFCWILIGGYKAQDTFDKTVTDSKQSNTFSWGNINLRSYFSQIMRFWKQRVTCKKWLY